MARPTLPIEARQVAALVALGLSAARVADFFGCSRSTIHKRFAAELRRARASAAAAPAAAAGGPPACFGPRCLLPPLGRRRPPWLGARRP